MASSLFLLRLPAEHLWKANVYQYHCFFADFHRSHSFLAKLTEVAVELELQAICAPREFVLV